MKNKKLSKKAKDTLERMKQNRQIDSNNLREVIIAKSKWAKAEIENGETRIKTIRTQINRLEGIILFCNDLLEPTEGK